MKLEIKENDILVFAIGLTIFIFFLTLVVLNSGIKSTEFSIKIKQSKYEKSLTLYDKIKSTNKQKKVFKKDMLIFVQQLETLKNLKNKIVSVNSTGIDNGVQIRIVGINLPQLVNIFQSIEKYGNIKISQFMVKRNFASTKLLDLSIVLRKKT